MSSDIKKKTTEEVKEEKGVVKTIPTPIKEKIIRESIKEENIMENDRIKIMREKIVSSTNSVVIESSQMESLIKLFQVLQISDYESDNLDDEQRNIIQNMCNVLGINLVFTEDGFCEPVDFSDYEGEDVDCKIMPSTKVVLPDEITGDLLVALDGYDRMLSSSVLRIDKNIHKKMAILMEKPIDTINMIDDYISLLSKIQCFDIEIDKELKADMNNVIDKLRLFVVKYVDEKNLFYSKKFNEIEWEAIELAKEHVRKKHRRVEAINRLDRSVKKQRESINPTDLDEFDEEKKKKTSKEKLTEGKKKIRRKKKKSDDEDEEDDKKSKKRKRRNRDEDEDDKPKKKKKKKKKDSDDDDDSEKKSKKSRKKRKSKDDDEDDDKPKKDKIKKKKKKKSRDDDEDEDDDRKSRRDKKKKKSKKDKDDGDQMKYLKIDMDEVKELVDDILEDYEDDIKDINKKLYKDLVKVSEALDDEDDDAVVTALALILIISNSVKLDKRVKKTIVELTSLGDSDNDDEDDDDDRKSRRDKKKSKSKKKSRRDRDDDEDDEDEEDRKTRRSKSKKKKKKSRDEDDDEDEEDRKSRKNKKKKKSRRDRDEDEKGGNKMAKKIAKKLEGVMKKYKKDLKEADLLDDMKELVSDAKDGDASSKDMKKFLKKVKGEDKKLYKKIEKLFAGKESDEVDADEVAAILKKMVKNHEDELDDADLLDTAEDLLDNAKDEDVDMDDINDFVESLEDDRKCKKSMKKLIKKLKSVADSEDDEDDEDDDDDRKSRRDKKKSKSKKKSRRDRDDEIDFDEVEDEIGKSDIKDIKRAIKDADLKSKVEEKLIDLLDDADYEELLEVAEDKSSKLGKKLTKIFRGLARVSSSSDDEEVDYFIGDSDELEIVYSIEDVENTDEYEDAPKITSKNIRITHEPNADEYDVPIIIFNRRTVKKDPRFR